MFGCMAAAQRSGESQTGWQRVGGAAGHGVRTGSERGTRVHRGNHGPGTRKVTPRLHGARSACRGRAAGNRTGSHGCLWLPHWPRGRCGPPGGGQRSPATVRFSVHPVVGEHLAPRQGEGSPGIGVGMRSHSGYSGEAPELAPLPALWAGPLCSPQPLPRPCPRPTSRLGLGAHLAQARAAAPAALLAGRPVRELGPQPGGSEWCRESSPTPQPRPQTVSPRPDALPKGARRPQGPGPPLFLQMESL